MFINSKYSRQPPSSRIDWSSPISKGLLLAVDSGTFRNNTNTGTKILSSTNGLVRGFGPTDGISSSDVLSTGVTDSVPKQHSMLAVFSQNSSGGSTVGRLLHNDNGCGLVAYQAADVTFLSPWSSGAVVWKLFTPTAGVLYTIVLSYNPVDAGGTPPFAAVDGVIVTPTLTQASGGAQLANQGTWWIGNRNTTTPDRHWDGKIGLVARWNRALSNAEVVNLSKNPWQLFKRQTPIFTPTGDSGVLIPDITDVSAIDISATEARPTAAVTY